MQHLLTLADVSADEIAYLCANARLMKHKRGAIQPPALAGHTIALLFEKPSLRTRVSFEVAARELGANCLYLSPQEVGLNKREATADVARVLSRYVHCVVLRTFDHATVEEFAHSASIPVINGLTDAHHPCQGLTDAFTIVEQCEAQPHPIVAYLGDGNNCAHSLLQAGVKLGMHLRIATPPGYAPSAQVVAQAQCEAKRTGGSVTLMTDTQEAARGADVLYTDVWASMGQEAEIADRRAIFAPYRIDAALLALARPAAIVLHPLPAHRGDEIATEVIDGPHSRVFVQAENRLHMQKAILRRLLTTSQSALANLSA
ncbi:MAG: ornithine carbamoyltransferase [Ktedonobacterales bacterium]|nr:ornithine carbamoyltransferase [Ktedonobacterales bacterium]